MRFINAMRKMDVLGPLRHGFDTTQWTFDKSRLADDANDERLHEAGILIFGKANEIRSKVHFAYTKQCTDVTKIRAFVAMTNYMYVRVAEETKDALEKITDKKTGLVMLDVATMTLRLPVGGSFTPDEIVQSLVSRPVNNFA